MTEAKTTTIATNQPGGEGLAGNAIAYRYLDPAIVIFLKIFRVDLVCDIGANRGQFARELINAGYEGRILSFEPQSAAYADLLEACRHFPLWTAAPRCAIGDCTEIIELNLAKNSESSSLLPMLARHEAVAPASRYVASELVQMRRLDDVAEPELSDAARPFLKLDVQGFESRVLDGAESILRRVVGLQVELDLVSLYDGSVLMENIVARLRGLGFTPYRIVPGFTDRRSGRMLQVDGMFFREGLDRT